MVRGDAIGDPSPEENIMQPSNKANQLSLFDDEPQEAAHGTTAALEPFEDAPVEEEPHAAIGEEQDQLDEDALDEHETAKLRALWTQHFVQPYRTVKVKRKRRLELAERLAVSSADAALERAERLFESGRYEGVVAYTVTTESGGGEYVETQLLARLGKVPGGEYEE